MKKVPLAERRATVNELWNCGIRDAPVLAKLSGVPLSTSYKYVAQLKKNHELKPISRPGRPTILAPKDRTVLGRIVQNDRYLTCKEIAIKLSSKVEISARTVNRELNKLGYHSSHPKTVPLLTAKQCERRVEWATTHLEQDWKTVVFSDETTFQMFRNTMKAFHKVGTSVPHKGVPKHPAKVHVWGAFSACGTIGFHMFTQNMDGRLYREILTNHLFENASRVMPSHWIYQQDNDPKHTAKETSKLLHCRVPAVLDWPSYSPDLNPIENLWAIIKKRVEKRVNKIIRKKKKITIECWYGIIREEWEDISEELCLNLINGMPGRLDEVIQTNGKRINH
jgi:transposase